MARYVGVRQSLGFLGDQLCELLLEIQAWPLGHDVFDGGRGDTEGARANYIHTRTQVNQGYFRLTLGSDSDAACKAIAS